jgi:hypothetical protein
MSTKAPDYSPIIFKLLEKSESGKVGWEVNTPYDNFRAELEEGFVFSVDRETDQGDTTYTVRMRDGDRRTIFDLSLTDDPETMINRRPLYKALETLYDLARRKALNVDQKVERVSEILERI